MGAIAKSGADRYNTYSGNTKKKINRMNMKLILAMLIAGFVFVPDTEAFWGEPNGGKIALCLTCKLFGNCPERCGILGRSETEFDMADLNNDGKLSFKELDVDGNGFLDDSDFNEPNSL